VQRLTQHVTRAEADPEADLSLANGSSPEEDDIQGFTVQVALRLSKASILAEVDELEVVHAKLVDAPGGSALTNAMVLAIHTEVLEALLQCWVCFRACVQTAQAECICQASSCGHCSC